MEFDKLNTRYGQDDSPPKFLGEESSAKRFELQGFLELFCRRDSQETLNRILMKLRNIKEVDDLTTRYRYMMRNDKVKDEKLDGDLI